MDDLEYRIGKLRLKPGDVLVVKVDRAITYDTMQRIRDYASRETGDARVLILEAGVDLSVLTREEIESRVAPATEATPVA